MKSLFVLIPLNNTWDNTEDVPYGDQTPLAFIEILLHHVEIKLTLNVRQLFTAGLHNDRKRTRFIPKPSDLTEVAIFVYFQYAKHVKVIFRKLLSVSHFWGPWAFVVTWRWWNYLHLSNVNLSYLSLLIFCEKFKHHQHTILNICFHIPHVL